MYIIYTIQNYPTKMFDNNAAQQSVDQISMWYYLCNRQTILSLDQWGIAYILSTNLELQLGPDEIIDNICEKQECIPVGCVQPALVPSLDVSAGACHIPQ